MTFAQSILTPSSVVLATSGAVSAKTLSSAGALAFDAGNTLFVVGTIAAPGTVVTETGPVVQTIEILDP